MELRLDLAEMKSLCWYHNSPALKYHGPRVSPISILLVKDCKSGWEGISDLNVSNHVICGIDKAFNDPWPFRRIEKVHKPQC